MLKTRPTIHIYNFLILFFFCTHHERFDDVLIKHFAIHDKKFPKTPSGNLGGLKIENLLKGP
jgi:hypothetical protein